VEEQPSKRRYHSPRRHRQAQLTRRAVLEAARRLFAAHGYTTTTLPAIAREANVSPPTVTAVFGTKGRLLRELIDLAVRGDVDDLPLAQQSWWLAMLSEVDARRQLALFAANGRRIHERSADVAEIVRGAASAEPEIAAILQQLASGRLADSRTVAQSLDEKHSLAAGVTVERAADMLWALGLHDLYRLLVVERHWSPEEYERWLAASLVHSLLEGPDSD
jgi:AcrR family transcriptional regulator